MLTKYKLTQYDRLTKWSQVEEQFQSRLKEALESVRGLKNAVPIKFETVLGNMYYQFERGWGVEVQLEVKLKDSEAGDGVFVRKLEFSLNWSSTSRSTVVALAAANLYQEVAAVAVELEAAFPNFYLLDEN